MKTENEIAQELQSIDNSTIKKACDLLRRHGAETFAYLADMVAAVCEVDTAEMLNDTKHLKNSHARWLFWYAYRYVTNEGYDSIANKTAKKRKFTASSVGYCITNMSMMVDSEPIWKKRWIIIKRVINAILNNEQGNKELSELQETLTFKLFPPKGFKGNVKVQVIQDTK